MRKYFIFIALFFFLLINNLYAVQNEPFRFAFNFSEYSNLTYQLDCLNNLTYCTRDDYEALWKKEFLKNEEDKRMLESWRIIRNRYQKYFEIDSSIKFPLDPRANGVNLFTKIQIAGLQAKSLEDYLSRLDLLVVPFEREEFVKVIKYFQPRFSVWWECEAKIKGAAFVKKTENLMATESIKTNISKFYRFYQPSLPEGYLITFDFFYRPQVVKAGSGGQAIENQLLVEFFSDENPKRRLDVVLHEFCHFMFNSQSPENHLKLQNLFMQSGPATAIPAYGLMDESLAAAFGNGMIARSFSTPESWKEYFAFERSFYNNLNIDKTGKAMLPILDEWLSKGGKINDENFVKIYIEILEKTFGDKLTSPTLYLAQAFLFLDSNFETSLRQIYRQNLNTASLYSQQGDLSKNSLSDFFNNPNLSSVFIIHPKNVGQLATKKVITNKDQKEIEKTIKTEKRALYSIKRNENAYLFIIAAEDNNSAIELIKDLAGASKAFTGKFVKSK